VPRVGRRRCGSLNHCTLHRKLDAVIQTFSDGPYRMAFDAVNRIVYAASWNEGVWALAVP
jgi:hypothetical protein